MPSENLKKLINERVETGQGRSVWVTDIWTDTKYPILGTFVGQIDPVHRLGRWSIDGEFMIGCPSEFDLMIGGRTAPVKKRRSK